MLSGVNTVTFNDFTVDIDLSVCVKSSAETMAGKGKQMSTPQKQVRGWNKPAPNCRNIRSKSIGCVTIFEAIQSV